MGKRHKPICLADTCMDLSITAGERHHSAGSPCLHAFPMPQQSTGMYWVDVKHPLGLVHLEIRRGSRSWLAFLDHAWAVMSVCTCYTGSSGYQRGTKYHPLSTPVQQILIYCTAKTSYSLIFLLHAMLAPITSCFFPSEKAKLSLSP